MKTETESKYPPRPDGCETNVIPFKSEATAPSDGRDGHPDAAAKARVAEATKRFHDLLLSGEGEDLGLNYEKFVSRSSDITESEEMPGRFVISVERHRSVAGGTYRKGLPMNAFETYTQRILFDPAAGTTTEIADEHCGYDINIYDLASEAFDCDWRPVVYREEGWDQKRRVEVPVDHFKFETDSYEEARCRIERYFRELNHESQFETLDLPEDVKSDYVQMFEDAFAGLALDALERGWAEPKLADD